MPQDQRLSTEIAAEGTRQRRGGEGKESKIDIVLSSCPAWKGKAAELEGRSLEFFISRTFSLVAVGTL